MVTDDIPNLLQPIAEALLARGLTLAVMESCTGGLLSAGITSTPGCGDYFLGGAVAYATESKVSFGVDEAVIRDYGVVSAETASAMAQTVARSLGADIGIGLTGVAGPAPQDGEPVGRVFIAVASEGNAHGRRYDFGETHPDEVKVRAALEAIRLLGRRVMAAAAD